MWGELPALNVARMRGTAWAFACLLLLLPSCREVQKSGAQVPPLPSDGRDETAARIDALFQLYNEPDSPGCAIGVMKAGELVYSKAYGSADVQNRVPLTIDSIFNIGSISKQFTALSILLLANDGKLRLDEPIQKYIPELPEYSKAITIRHLLEHSSGLRDQDELLKLGGWHTYEDLITNRDILSLIIRQQGLNFSPGEECAYSDTNYTLLSLIIERVGGMSLREFERSHIFGPLGMNHTLLRDDHTLVVKNGTFAYIRDANGTLRTGMTNDESTGAGNVLTSITDYVQWDKNFYTEQVGGPDAIRLMQTPGHLRNGTVTPYGLGLQVRKYRGLTTVEHGGADAGYHSFYLRFPDQQLSVVVFCNIRDHAGASPSQLAKSVADIFLPTAQGLEAESQNSTIHRNSMSLPRDELEACAGIFYNRRDGSVIVFRVVEDALTLIEDVTSPNSTSKLICMRSGRFLTQKGDSFEFDDDASTGEVIARDGTSATTFVRMAPASILPKALSEFEGSYRSNDVGSTWSVLAANGKLLLRRARFADETLLPVFRDAFYSEQWTLVFTRDGSGQVNGVTATNERVREVRFQRQ